MNEVQNILRANFSESSFQTQIKSMFSDGYN